MNQEHTTPNKKNHHVIVAMIVVFIVIALALMQSLVGATGSFMTRKDVVVSAVTKTQSSASSVVASSAETKPVTVLRETTTRVAGFFGVSSSTSSVKTATPVKVVTKPLSKALTIRNFFSVVGKPQNGQVLMYINGRLEWQDIVTAAMSADATEGSVHVSGRGRKPIYPINGSEALHSAAGGGVSPERHYGGGGGNNSNTDTNGGTTTNVTNNYTTYNTSGGSGSATFVGTTPVTSYNGQFTSGLKTGYDAANTICDAAYTGSHMCRTDEILDTIATKDISTLFSGIADAWIAEGPPGYTADSNDCRGWTSSNLAHLGPWWDFATSGGGVGYLTNCSTTKPIACCKAQ